MAQCGQAHLVQQRLGTQLGFSAAHASVQQGQGDVLQHIHALEQIEALEYKTNRLVTHLSMLRCVQGGHLFVIEVVAARVRAVQQAQKIHQRALARAAGAHECHIVSFLHLQIDSM